MNTELRDFFLGIVKQYIRPVTDPVGIFLEYGEGKPEGYAYPTEKFGGPLCYCQGSSIARRMGVKTAFRPEDCACPPALCAMNSLPQESIDTWRSGAVCAPAYAADAELGAKIEAYNVMLKKAPTCICFSPYEKMDFDPDIVLIHGNSAQVTRVAQGYAYFTGDGIKSTTLGRLACAGYINKVYETQEPTIIIPGGGERVFGTLQDDELIVSLPFKFLETTAKGIEAVHKAGYAQFPTFSHGIVTKPRMPGKYVKALMPK